MSKKARKQAQEGIAARRGAPNGTLSSPGLPAGRAGRREAVLTSSLEGRLRDQSKKRAAQQDDAAPSEVQPATAATAVGGGGGAGGALPGQVLNMGPAAAGLPRSSTELATPASAKGHKTRPIVTLQEHVKTAGHKASFIFALNVNASESQRRKLKPSKSIWKFGKTSQGGRARSKTTVATSIFEAIQARATQRSCPCFWTVWQFYFHPNRGFRRFWDALLLVLVMFSVFNEPYKAAFKLPSIPPGEPTMSLFEWFVDILFYVDMVLCFWTGVDTGYAILGSKREVAKAYLSGWFIIDFAATIEWDLLVRKVKPDANQAHLGLVRMVKVARLARVGRLMSRLSAQMTIDTGWIEGGKFLIIVLVVSHILACLFYMVPTIVECDARDFDLALRDVPGHLVWWDKWYLYNGTKYEAWDDPKANGVSIGTLAEWARWSDDSCLPFSWRTAYGLEERDLVSGDLKMSAFRRYLDAMYWSLTTMTTIGYGDRGPKTLKEEIMFTMMAEVIGLSFFALLLQQITNINDIMGRDEFEKNEIKNHIMRFMKYNQLDPRLRTRVVHYLNFKASTKSGHALPQSGVFTQLSPALKREIEAAMYGTELVKLRIFGQNAQDLDERGLMRKMFFNIDEDNSKSLNENEISSLLGELGLRNMGETEFRKAMIEMSVNSSAASSDDEEGDSSHSQTQQVHVELKDFEIWWYSQKHGRPPVENCPGHSLHLPLRLREEGARLEEDGVHSTGAHPGGLLPSRRLRRMRTTTASVNRLAVQTGEDMDLLGRLSQSLRTLAAAPGDTVVEAGCFCKRLFVVQQGGAVARDITGVANDEETGCIVGFEGFGSRRFLDKMDFRGQMRDFCSDPVFGLQCIYTDERYDQATEDLRHVEVYAVSAKMDSDAQYSEFFYFEREDLLTCMEQCWPAGIEQWESIAARVHYRMLRKSIRPPNSAKPLNRQILRNRRQEGAVRQGSGDANVLDALEKMDQRMVAMERMMTEVLENQRRLTDVIQPPAAKR